uniref:C-type lectin domain-containing protein n=1 Tax=Neogobius melanostomus TaxID=47308 RepID=A0A8C6TLP1_9GOBI
MAAHCLLITFFCLAAALLTAGDAVGNDQGCPAGWTPFGTRCFKFFDSTSTWTNAEKTCHSQGANLASIHSADENAFIIRLIREATGEDRQTWIGGHDAFKDDVWMWTDGSVWDYSNWAPRQPDNFLNREKFLMVNWRANPGSAWDDGPEHEPRAYICAKNTSSKVSLILEDIQYTCTSNLHV